jgi:hypothetical protein
MSTCARLGFVGAAPRATPRRRPGTRVRGENHKSPVRDRCARATSSPRDAETSLPATSLWLATLRAAEGDDIAPAAALVNALEPGSEAARSALDEMRSAEGGVSGTPLWLACVAARNGAPGAIELALSMVDKGADCSIPGTQGVAGDSTTPLWWAAAAVEAGVTGAVDLARRLVDAGVDVDAEGTYDVVRGPPLLWAAVAVRNGEDANGLALAEVLLSADANPNLRGSYGPTAVGVTPLMLAAQAAPENGGCVRLCAALLEAGATMEANEVSSLLMYRVGSSLVAVKNLLKGGRGD